MHTSTAESEKEITATLKGLPVHSKPEWTDVGFGPDYRANISVIGSHIILSQPVGNIGLTGVKKSLDLIDRIIAENIPENQPYVIIEDFINLRSNTFDARKYFINNMRQRVRLAGLVFCSASPLLKISIKLGKRLVKDERAIRMAADYNQAVEFALEILSKSDTGLGQSGGMTVDIASVEPDSVSDHDIIKNKAWSINFDGFSTKMQIINQKVLHSTSTGLMKADHIEAVAKMREKVQKAIMPEGGIEYVVADVANLKGGNREARKLYMDSLKQWHRTHPLRMYIFFGTNRFIRAASNLARPFMPFKIRVADNLEDALKIVSRDQIEKNNHISHSEPANTETNADEDDRIQSYVEEFQQLLGNIDWERDGSDDLWQSDSSHPFSTVFKSIALIKGELDELIRDRDKAEEALRRANDELEARVKERTLELENANQELRTEIRERKKIEVEMQSARQLAESASRAKSDFLANMSHELRTPLNHIIGFTELILDKRFGELNEIQEEYLKDVDGSSKHLLSLINDVLDLSKIEAGKIEIKPIKVNLPTLLQNSIVLVKAKALKHSIQLSLEMKDIPETITVDERKVKQILYNLLSNAVKFTPDGGQVWLTAQSCELDDDHDSTAANSSNGCVKISVSDTGIGLKSEDLNRIFSPFEQADNSTNRRFNGTGLGLSLTRNLVELHGGRLWAESEGEGKGCSFHFILPL